MYVGKYLSKARIEGLNGRRLWAPFGDWEASKVRDIVVNSEWGKTYRLLAASISGFKELRWDQRARIVSRVCLGESFPQALACIGLEENWDAEDEARQEYFVFWSRFLSRRARCPITPAAAAALSSSPRTARAEQPSEIVPRTAKRQPRRA